MQLILQVVSPAYSGQKIWLRPGQNAIVGRTEDADYVFRSDESMSSTHFALVWREAEWFIHDLHSSAGTLVNGESIAERSLHDADQVVAGRTSFVVQIEGDHRPHATVSTSATTNDLKSDSVSVQPIGAWMLVAVPAGWTITPKGLNRTNPVPFPSAVVMGESALPPGQDLASYVELQRSCLVESPIVAQVDLPRPVLVQGSEEAREFTVRLHETTGIALVQRYVFARRGSVLANATLITSAELFGELDHEFDQLIQTIELANQ